MSVNWNSNTNTDASESINDNYNPFPKGNLLVSNGSNYEVISNNNINGQILTTNNLSQVGLEWTTPGGVGEVNTLSSVGGGTSIVSGKVGTDLQTKSFNFDSNYFNVTEGASLVGVGLKSIVLNSVSVVANTVARDALIVEVGDIARVTDLNKSYVYNGTSWIELTDGNTTDHTQLSNIGINSHAIIDSHLTSGILHRTINDSITSSTELWSSTKISSELGGKAPTSHAHSAGDITSGTLADARIASSNITQHEGSITHQNLSGSGTNTHAQIDTHITDATKHRQINDSVISATNLYSNQKIENNERSLLQNVINNGFLINSDLNIVNEGSNYYYLKTNTLLPSGWHLNSFDPTIYPQSGQPFKSTNDASFIQGGTDVGSVDNYLYMWVNSSPIELKSILLRMVVNASHLTNFYVNEFDTQLSFDDSERRPYFTQNILSPSIFLPAIISPSVPNRIAILISKSNDGLRLYGSLSLFGMSSNALGEARDVIITNIASYQGITRNAANDGYINTNVLQSINNMGTVSLVSSGFTNGQGRLKGLLQGTNVTLTNVGNDVQISASGGGGSSDLNGLSDVTISGLAYADRLVYDGFGWVNGPYNITSHGSGSSIVKTHEADTVFYKIKGSTSVAINLTGDDLVFTSSNPKITSDTIQISDDADWKLYDNGSGIQITKAGTAKFALSDSVTGLCGFNPISNYTSAFVFPSGSILDRPTIGHNMTRYNTTDSKLEYCNGTNWVQLDAGGSVETLSDRFLIDYTRGEGKNVGRVLGQSNVGNSASGLIVVDKRGVLWSNQGDNNNNAVYRWSPTDRLDNMYNYTFSTITATVTAAYMGGYSVYNSVSDKAFFRYYGNAIQVIECDTSTPVTYNLTNTGNSAGMVAIDKYVYLMGWGTGKVHRIDTINMTDTVYTGLYASTILRPVVIGGNIWGLGYYSTNIVKFDIDAGTTTTYSHGGSENFGFSALAIGKYIYSEPFEDVTSSIVKFDTELLIFKRIAFPGNLGAGYWNHATASPNGYIMFFATIGNPTKRIIILDTYNDTFIYDQTVAYCTNKASTMYNPFTNSWISMCNDGVLRFFSCGQNERTIGQISEFGSRLPPNKLTLGGTRYVENEGGGGEDVCVKDSTDLGHLFSIRRNSTNGQSGFHPSKIQTAVQLPVLTTSARNALTNLNEGCVIWNTSSAAMQIYNGSVWLTVVTV